MPAAPGRMWTAAAHPAQGRGWEAASRATHQTSTTTRTARPLRARRGRPAPAQLPKGCPPDCAGSLLPGPGRPRSFLRRSAGSVLALFPCPASRCDPAGGFAAVAVTHRPQAGGHRATRTRWSGRDREAQLSTSTYQDQPDDWRPDRLAALHEQISDGVAALVEAQGWRAMLDAGRWTEFVTRGPWTRAVSGPSPSLGVAPGGQLAVDGATALHGRWLTSVVVTTGTGTPLADRAAHLTGGAVSISGSGGAAPDREQPDGEDDCCQRE